MKTSKTTPLEPIGQLLTDHQKEVIVDLRRYREEVFNGSRSLVDHNCATLDGIVIVNSNGRAISDECKYLGEIK